MKGFLIALLVWLCLLLCFVLSFWLFCNRPSPEAGMIVFVIGIALTAAACVMDDRRFRKKWGW